MIPEDVFHYTKMSTVLEKILPERRIKFRQLEFMNDPREAKERLFAIIAGFRLSPNKHNEALNEMNEVVKKEWKVFCASQHCPDYTLHMSEITYPFYLGDCRSRMWATYADNHRGVCLKFDGLKFNERLHEELGSRCKIFCGSVDYDNSKSIDLSTIDFGNNKKADLKAIVRDHSKRYWEELFLVKSEDWRTEFEYRWLVHSLEDSDEYISIEGVIEGVLVGQDFPKVYLPSLKKLCRKLEIPAGHIEWSNGIPHCHYFSIHKP